MDIDLTTPALLFPAVSLLLLAFTNRFLALAALIRSLHERYQANVSDRSMHEQYQTKANKRIIAQIDNLRYRVILIRNMQAFGVSSMLLCVLCMFLLFFGQALLGKIVFGASLVLMIISLGLSIREIQVSVNALHLELRDLESYEDKAGKS
jgi:hypothetical protein